jgi:hypothetical protein
MKMLLATAACLAAFAAPPAFAADMPSGYHQRTERRVVSEERVVRVLPVAGRSDIRTSPWLHYDVRPQMICRLAWEADRRGRYPVEVCARW